MGRIIRRVMVAGFGFFFATALGHATTHDFYEGKVVRIIVGFSAGGAFGAYSRSLSRHMRNYIPGGPTITVENMAGAVLSGLRFHQGEQAKPFRQNR